MEKYGTEKLKECFKVGEIPLTDRFNRLSLFDVETFLYGLKLIPAKYFTWIGQIWHERSDIIHPKGRLPAYVGKEANNKYRPMISHALEVMRFLKSKSS